MDNIGRAIVKKLAVKFEGNEVLSIDDFDIFACYRDLWKTASEKKNAIRQGIISNGGYTINCMRLRIAAGDKDTTNSRDNAIATAYWNKFIIPLDKVVLLYDRVLRHRQILVNKKDTTWNWSFNMPYKSLKGILVLFEGEQPYIQDMSKFYNPKIQKVSVIVEGKPNQLYAQRIRSFEQYDETCKYFTEGKQRTTTLMKFKTIYNYTM